MKIKEGVFLCPKCDVRFQQSITKKTGNGKKGRASDQAVCPKCIQPVSQKTKYDLMNK